MKHSELYRVGTCDIDMNGYLTAGAILRYVQDAANRQHEIYGPTTADLRRDGKAFVLSRLALDIHCGKLAESGVCVSTWYRYAKGFMIERNTVVTQGERPGGCLLASLSALWGLLDLNARKPLKVDTLNLGFTPEDESVTTQMPIRFSLPQQEYLLLGHHTVSFSECDENHHLNNTHYPEIFCDLTENMENKRVTGLSISYRSEAMYGAEFSVYGGSDGDSNGDSKYYRTVLENGQVGAEALMRFENIN